MVDLGPYAFEVLTAYGVTLAATGGIVWLSIAKARRVKARLAEVEARRIAPAAPPEAAQ